MHESLKNSRYNLTISFTWRGDFDFCIFNYMFMFETDLKKKTGKDIQQSNNTP